MFRACAIPLFLSFALLAVAAEPQILTNTGEAMRVAYTCPDDDMQFAGMYCSESEPCAIYLELSAVAASARKILISGNLHSSSATLYSVLLSSDDAGATWKEPVARIRGSAIDQLQVLDAQHAWAAGETQYPLARDPFFLVTTDGGFSWRQRPVSDDGGPGSVQVFSFDNAQHGELVIDAGNTSSSGRYVSYESQTGGESWTMRSTTQQLPRIKTPAADTSWRLEPAKDEKSWQLEKRDGNQWTPAAAFLIEVAKCSGEADAAPGKAQ
ncbi:MAG TPA: hypothetical protein VEF06_02360 [Bryobacteraceae bacterium]|nr:hypothetical protein [Bryobacteraceae bacterium]